MFKHYSHFITDYSETELPIVTDNKNVSYINVECGFDIETTSTKIEGEKFSFMYIWLFGLGYGKPVYYGNSWDEFREFCEQLQDLFFLN